MAARASRGDASAPLAVVAAYARELRALRKRLEPTPSTRSRAGSAIAGRVAGSNVLLRATGDGASRAGEELGRLLDGSAVRAVLGIGIAGALSPDLGIGQVVVADTIADDAGETAPPDRDLLVRARRLAGVTAGAILSQRDIAGDPLAKNRLWREHGRKPALVVDLESAAWARVAAERGIPFLVIRAVSDGHDETLPLDFNRFRGPDGGVDHRRVWRHVAVRPLLVPKLLLLRTRVKQCAERLADVVEGILER